MSHLGSGLASGVAMLLAVVLGAVASYLVALLLEHASKVADLIGESARRFVPRCEVETRHEIVASTPIAAASKPATAVLHAVGLLLFAVRLRFRYIGRWAVFIAGPALDVLVISATSLGGASLLVGSVLALAELFGWLTLAASVLAVASVAKLVMWFDRPSGALRDEWRVVGKNESSLEARVFDALAAAVPQGTRACRVSWERPTLRPDWRCVQIPCPADQSRPFRSSIWISYDPRYFAVRAVDGELDIERQPGRPAREEVAITFGDGGFAFGPQVL